MSPTEVLHKADTRALSDSQIVSRVVGKGSGKGTSGKLKAFGATGVIMVILLIAGVFLGSGFLIPTGLMARVMDATDVVKADAIESQIIVFSEALKAQGLTADQNAIPSNTIERLRDNGIMVGYSKNGEFVEDNKGGKELSVLYNGRVISAAGLYNAFNTATYSGVSYYYDDAAREVLKRIGRNSLNNYSADGDFEEISNKLMGEGSDIKVNNVGLFERENEDGETEYYYDTVGVNTSSETAGFIGQVAAKNKAGSVEVATLNGADTLTVADTISKEQRSSLIFLNFMENISKMKAGDGGDSKINDAMNMLYRVEKSEVVDVNTGEVITVEGSMMDSPSLVAILSGERVDLDAVENYSSERILKTVENLSESQVSGETLSGTISSTTSKIRGAIGRFLTGGNEDANSEILSTVAPTVEKSLVNNSFSTSGGVAGGELLAEGAVNVNRMIAMASGATGGNEKSIKAYNKLTSDVLALEAEADKNNRSPLDISSENTFLGNFVRKFAYFVRDNRLIGNIVSSLELTGKTLGRLVPSSYADDEANTYLSEFGDCERLERIGANGTATCAAIVTFDVTTLDGIYDDADYIAFVEDNTELLNGTRVIKKNSKLADFIMYNDERMTPLGVTDGGIISAIRGGNTKIPFVSDILTMIENWLGTNEEELRMASGEAFINSDDNPDWQVYKYAQRYVALARALSVLRQYDGDATAYANLKYFEGYENPVTAFLNGYHDSLGYK